MSCLLSRTYAAAPGPAHSQPDRISPGCCHQGLKEIRRVVSWEHRTRKAGDCLSVAAHPGLPSGTQGKCCLPRRRHLCQVPPPCTLNVARSEQAMRSTEMSRGALKSPTQRKQNLLRRSPSTEDIQPHAHYDIQLVSEQNPNARDKGETGRTTAEDVSLVGGKGGAGGICK